MYKIYYHGAVLYKGDSYDEAVVTFEEYKNDGNFAGMTLVEVTEKVIKKTEEN